MAVWIHFHRQTSELLVRQSKPWSFQTQGHIAETQGPAYSHDLLSAHMEMTAEGAFKGHSSSVTETTLGYKLFDHTYNVLFRLRKQATQLHIETKPQQWSSFNK